MKEPKDLTVAVQGFVNAGSIAAALLAGDGFSIPAVPDSGGGICSAKGLDVPAVTEQTQRLCWRRRRIPDQDWTPPGWRAAPPAPPRIYDPNAPGRASATNSGAKLASSPMPPSWTTSLIWPS